MTALDVGIAMTKILLVFSVVMGAVTYLTWVERRVSGFMQDRLGPNRVGPAGLLQPIADGIKFLFKEEVIPSHVHRTLYLLAPALSMIPALLTVAVIPFGTAARIFGREIPLIIADLNVGVLYILAISSLGVYGVVLAGWSSNNKYSLLGGLRASAQMISYELAMGLSIIGVLMISESLRLGEVVRDQAGWRWNILRQPLGFMIFLFAAFAETNRLPFDLPEAESELVAGYHTEYAGMKFALFYMAEYANMVTASALAAILFLGGWQVPLLDRLGLPSGLQATVELGAFLAKVAVLLFLFVWVRWTLPRFRFDQLMHLGWKVLLPLALANILVTGLVLLAGGH